MPKLKSHRGAVKRFRRNVNGKVKVRRANRNHILTKVRTKVKRQARRSAMVKLCDLKLVVRMLNGC